MVEVVIPPDGTVTGKAMVSEMRDKDGRLTDSWDEQQGTLYSSDDPDVASIVDEDADPLDAEIEAKGVGTTVVRCVFDGRKGPDVSTVTLISEPITVRLADPGEAVSATFTVTFTQAGT